VSDEAGSLRVLKVSREGHNDRGHPACCLRSNLDLAYWGVCTIPNRENGVFPEQNSYVRVALNFVVKRGQSQT